MNTSASSFHNTTNNTAKNTTNNITNNPIHKPQGLYIPVCTPMYKGKFDRQSYKNLVQHVEPYVDGFVPCLSSGEGHKMSIALWKEVLMATLENTTKPVYVGIKRQPNPSCETHTEKIASIKEQTLVLLQEAKTLGATGATIPLVGNSNQQIADYIDAMVSSSGIPLIIYNTEDSHINAIKTLEEIDKHDAIVAIKDSSMNPQFFQAMIKSKQEGVLRLSIFQGMEHELHTSLESDGFLISLTNVEPALCKNYLQTGSVALDATLKELFWKYNLGGDWYITLKAILMMKGLIASAEEINPFIIP